MGDEQDDDLDEQLEALGERELDEAQSLSEWLGGAPLGRFHHRLVGLVLPAVLCVLNAWRVSPHTVDDAYISFRYARNFAEGLGLVYNAGERIEGYTNFLWTVLLGLGIRLGVDPIFLAKGLGGLCAVATLWAVYAISHHLRPLSVVPCLSTWLIASTMAFAGHAVFGLETASFTALVTLGSWQLFREQAREAAEGWRWIPWSGLIFAAAGLTRPEAPMYLGLIMIFLGGAPLWPHPALGDESRRTLWLFGVLSVAVTLFGLTRMMAEPPSSSTVWIIAGVVLGLALVVALPRAIVSPRNLLRGALFVVPVAAHLLWRKSYYGRWLPNTLAAKTGNLEQQLAGGADYLRRFLDHEGPIIYLAFFGMGAAIAWRHRQLFAVTAIALCGVVYVVLVGGDWMVLYRFFTPLLPFLLLLAGLGARVLLEQGSRVVTYGLLLFGLVVVAHRGRQANTDVQLVLGKEKHFWDAAAGGVARWFATQEQQRGREAVEGTIALGDIGQIGYETGYPILDLLGLVDPVIAELPGGYTTKVGPGFRNRFFDAAPRYFILISAEGDCVHPSVIGSRILYHDPRFQERYRLQGRVPLDRGFGWCIYEHVDAGR